MFSLKFQNFNIQSQICLLFSISITIISSIIVFNFNSSSDKFQLNSYDCHDCILKMMSWLSSTCIQNFSSSLVFILEIDNCLKHTEIALFRQYITKRVWPFGQRYFLNKWWNESLILYKFLFQQASLSYLKTGVIPHSNNNQQLSIWHLLIYAKWCIYASVNRAIIGQIMACYQLSTKPLSEPMQAYCRLDLWKQFSVKFE